MVREEFQFRYSDDEDSAKYSLHELYGKVCDTATTAQKCFPLGCSARFSVQMQKLGYSWPVKVQIATESHAMDAFLGKTRHGA